MPGKVFYPLYNFSSPNFFLGGGEEQSLIEPTNQDKNQLLTHDSCTSIDPVSQQYATKSGIMELALGTAGTCRERRYFHGD